MSGCHFQRALVNFWRATDPMNAANAVSEFIPKTSIAFVQLYIINALTDHYVAESRHKAIWCL